MFRVRTDKKYGISADFTPSPNLQCEENCIRQEIAGHDPLGWPELGTYGINEFTTEGLATMAFPTLSPRGKSDPTSKQRHYNVLFTHGFKHLICYGDTSPNGSVRWRFASHPQ